MLPIWGAWLFYPVLVDGGDTVADSLYEPIDSISLEMIYPGLYHFYLAHQEGKATDPIEYFVAPENPDLGVVNQQRKPNIKLIVAPFPHRPGGSDQFFARGSFWNPLDNCPTGLTCYPRSPSQNINFCKFNRFILKNSIIEYRK